MRLRGTAGYTPDDADRVVWLDTSPDAAWRWRHRLPPCVPVYRRPIESGEFAHLQGLLYFTDGYGVFPDAPPAYRAIFVMLQYRYDDIDLPPWAEKLVLEADKPKGDEAWI